MLNQKNQKRLLEVFIVLALASLACNFPNQRNAVPPTVVPLSAEEAQQFEQNLRATFENTEAGREITVTIDDGQLSSYLAAKLAGETDQVISNPRVRMTNGRMEIFAQVKQGITVEAKSVVVPSVDSNGQPQLLVESVSLGSLPVPESMVSQMQGLVDNLLEDYLESADARFTITKLEINEGQLVVSGIPE